MQRITCAFKEKTGIQKGKLQILSIHFLGCQESNLPKKLSC
uniref:Uncharacterized protein n=1 Tax=Rhizophora mucronata TaxID=61149 RepID=A0A2P2QZW3_RHIMU